MTRSSDSDAAQEIARLRARLVEVERVLANYVHRYGLTDEARRVWKQDGPAISRSPD